MFLCKKKSTEHVGANEAMDFRNKATGGTRPPTRYRYKDKSQYIKRKASRLKQNSLLPLNSRPLHT